MFLQNVNTILFDWGGTLAFVARQIEAWEKGIDAACRVTAEHGLTHPHASAYLKQLLIEAEMAAGQDPEAREVDVDTLFVRWIEKCEWTCPMNGSRLAAIEAFGRNWCGCLDPLPGAQDTLMELRNRGYRLGLASNCWTPSAYARAEFARHGFAAYMHAVTFSCEIGYRKPSPVFYEAALRAVGVDDIKRDLSHVLFVGDSPLLDIAAPASMGMKTALVHTRPSVWPAEQFKQISPDLEVDTVVELLDYLPPQSTGAIASPP